MSSGSDSKVWVGDLDGFIDLDAMYRADELGMAEDARERSFRTSGDIPVLCGKIIRWETLANKRLGYNEWRWAVHLAESTISTAATGVNLERELIQAMINLGRGYAVRRYAKWENLPTYEVVTAALPFGFKSILCQYLSTQGLLAAFNSNKRIGRILQTVSDSKHELAYRRVGYIRTFIHSMAEEMLGTDGPRSLDKEATRKMLSLARLRYSVEELRFNSFSDIASLFRSYRIAREAVASDNGGSNSIAGKFIRNWPLRHLHPLTELFPYTLRHALNRMINNVESGAGLDRIIAVNELALANTAILLMRKSANPDFFKSPAKK
jgi:hypothetical protein